MSTLILDGSNDADVAEAVGLLAAGRIVAVPTETVYGLAADASNDDAVRRVFEAKGRPTNHPLIVHVADVERARKLSTDWTSAAEILAQSFWPGPLSILTRRSSGVSGVVTGGLDTVVLRVPDHPVMRRLLALVHDQGSIGLAAPSANRFGAVSPTTASHVVADLNGRIDAVLDGGPCSVGVESTIVDCTSEPAVILRPGGVAVEDIAAVFSEHGLSVEFSPGVVAENGNRGIEQAIAPGMLRSHYAPNTRLQVFETPSALTEARHAAQSRGLRVVELPHPESVYEYSRDLYASLRACDDLGADLIVGLLPRAVGLGAAVRDRLLKAAAER